MKVYKTYDEFKKSTPNVNFTNNLDPESCYESIICKTRLGTWIAILYDSDSNTMDIIAEFYSFKEALRWGEAHDYHDYGWNTDNPDEYDDYKKVT